MKKRGMKFVAIINACVMCIGITMTASASANAECKHPNVTQNSEIVAHWTGSHQVTLVQSKGPETCTYAHWMEKLSWVCDDCRTVVATDIYHHESHGLCGTNY